MLVFTSDETEVQHGKQRKSAGIFQPIFEGAEWKPLTG
jgi:hypothetical protein